MWDSEYKVYKSMPRTSLNVLGDLVDACRQSDVGSNKLKLDLWNAETDNLGNWLSLVAATK